MKTKQLMMLSGPSSHVKEALSQLGFVRDSVIHHSTFRAELESTKGVYVFQLPYQEQDGTMTLDGEASFFDGVSDSDVPEEIRNVALERWYALRSRVVGSDSKKAYSPDRGDRRPSGPTAPKPIEIAKNGSMVQDFEDMERMGRDLSRLKTGQQLKEEGLIDDPIQH